MAILLIVLALGLLFIWFPRSWEPDGAKSAFNIPSNRTSALEFATQEGLTRSGAKATHSPPATGASAPRATLWPDAGTDDPVDRQNVSGAEAPEIAIPIRPVSLGRFALRLERDAGAVERLSGDTPAQTVAPEAIVVEVPARRAALAVEPDAGTLGRAPAASDQARNVEPEPCGFTVCAAGLVCCNASCGTCTLPGERCSTLTCSTPPAPISVPCGRNTCPVDEACCNVSCGICAPPGAACDERLCD